jgi:hypothetical protein
MATGLLILGVGPATRLLTYIVGLDKTYEATIRLGVSTDSDDADGVETARADADALGAVTPERIAAGVANLTGAISQVPSTVSAIKVGGRRAYDLARAGEEVQLKARDVTVSRFEVLAVDLRTVAHESRRCGSDGPEYGCRTADFRIVQRDDLAVRFNAQPLRVHLVAISIEHRPDLVAAAARPGAQLQRRRPEESRSGCSRQSRRRGESDPEAGECARSAGDGYCRDVVDGRTKPAEDHIDVVP